MRRLISSLLLGAVAALPAHAADKVKVGFLSTLSGPGGALGVDMRDAFLLAVKLGGGKLGGLPAERERGRRPAEAGDRPRGGRALHQARPCRPHHRHGVLQRAAAGHASDPQLRHDLSQHQHRPRRLRGREVQPELLRRGLAERGHPRRHGRGDEPAWPEGCLPDRAQLSGRARDAQRFQAILQGQDRRRSLRQARPARLRGGDRQHPRRQARRRVLLPAGRHGHQLRQAVRRSRRR